MNVRIRPDSASPDLGPATPDDARPTNEGNIARRSIMGHRVEIVRVIDAHTVVDVESYQTAWSGGADRRPGFYVVSHADDDEPTGGPPGDRIAGPFTRLDEAMAAASASGFSRYR
jgi:hypothetical protein